MDERTTMKLGSKAHVLGPNRIHLLLQRQQLPVDPRKEKEVA